MSWLFTFLLYSVLLWLAAKCLVEILCYTVFRFLRVKARVGGFWFLSLRDVVLSLPGDGLTLSVGSLGLTTSFVDSRVKTLVAVVVNDLRVEAALMPMGATASTVDERDDVNCGNSGVGVSGRGWSLDRSKAKRLWTLFKYLSFHGFNVSFTASSFFLPNCLLHTSVQELALRRDSSKDTAAIDVGRDAATNDGAPKDADPVVRFLCLGFKTKVLQRDTGAASDGAESKPCVAELLVDVTATARFLDGVAAPDDARLIDAVEVGVKKPRLTFTEAAWEKTMGIVEERKRRKRRRREEDATSKSNRFGTEKIEDFVAGSSIPSWNFPPRDFSPFLPRSARLSVSFLEVAFLRDRNKSRSLVLTCGDFSLSTSGKFFLSPSRRAVSSSLTSFRSTSSSFPDVVANLTLARLSLVSTHVQLLQLREFSVDAETGAGRKLEVSVAADGLHLRCHFEECHYWIPLLARTTDSDKSTDASTGAAPPEMSPSPGALSSLTPKSLRVDASVDDASLSFMTVKGASVSLLGRRLKFASDLSSAEIGAAASSSSISIDAAGWRDLLDHISASLTAERTHGFVGAFAAAADPGRHGANDLFFNERLEMSLDREPDVSLVEVDVSSARFGWTTEAARVFKEILASGLVGKKSSRSSTNGEARTSSSSSSSFLKKLSLNLKATSLNLFAVCDRGAGVAVHIDAATFTGVVARHSITFRGTRVTTFSKPSSSSSSSWSLECRDFDDNDDDDDRVAFRLPDLRLKKKTTADGATTVSAEVSAGVVFCWCHALHLTVKSVAEEASNAFRALRPARGAEEAALDGKTPPQTPKSDLKLNVSVSAPLVVTLFVSLRRRLKFSAPELSISGGAADLLVLAPEVVVALDDHEDVAVVRRPRISFVAASAKMRGAGGVAGGDQDAFFDLKSPVNRLLGVEMESFDFIFPFQFDFDGMKEEAVNTIKWLKAIHEIRPKPFVAETPLPPDLNIKITDGFRIQLTCDPFEVKLLNNYDLLSDEFKEAQVRRQKLEDRISDRMTRGGPIGIGIGVGGEKALNKAQVDELWQKLSARNASIYVQRSRKLYDQSSSGAGRESLVSIVGRGVEVTALTDTSIHGRDAVVAAMKVIDVESPFPDNLEFSTLWCRYVHATFKETTVRLRDYPQPLLEMKSGFVVGRLCGAEIAPQWRSVRRSLVELEPPWTSHEVTRSMCPLKFYHDLNGEMDSVFFAHGPCWDPALAEVGAAFDHISAPSVDPSPPLPFWDKLRLFLHGRLTLSTKCIYKFSYLTSLDPYNQTEMLDLVWSGGHVVASGGSGNWQGLGGGGGAPSAPPTPSSPPQIPAILDWTNGQIAFRGFLDVFVRTASKYDDCHLLHVPHLRLEVRLDWHCPGGNPNDHHLVAATAPDRVHDVTRASSHDSFRAFRSDNLEMTFDFKTLAPKTPRRSSRGSRGGRPVPPVDDAPTVLLYASTLRWLKDFRQIASTVSRPIRKGKLFKGVDRRKQPFGRHVTKVHCNINFHKFFFRYWASYAKQYGVEMQSRVFRSWNRFEQRLGLGRSGGDGGSGGGEDDGLIRRPISAWEITSWQASLEDVWVRLCSARAKTKSGLNVEAVNRGAVDRKFFLRLQRISYERRAADPGTASPPSAAPSSSKSHDSLLAGDEGLRADSPHPDADEPVPETPDELESAAASSAAARERLYKSKEPFHRLLIIDLKGSWNVTNRDIIYGLHEAYRRAQTLKICLSTDALKTVKVDDKKDDKKDEKGTTTPATKRPKREPRPSPMTQFTMAAHSEMMKILEKTEIETRPWAHCEDKQDVNEATENLQGLKLAVKLDDVVDKVCRIEFHNSQIMLKGRDEPGHLIVGFANAVIEQNAHRSVWKNQELRSKSGWSASLEGMQYFATVSPPRGEDSCAAANDENVEWVSKEVIEDPVGELNLATPADGVAIPGSGREAGGVLSDTVGIGCGGVGGEAESKAQLQRIISRCGCQIYYVTYSNMAEVGHNDNAPPQVQEDDQLFHKGISGEAVVDEPTLTVCHHDLNVVTNTYQFHLVLDILNNVLLYVAPHTKEANAKLLKQRLFATMVTLADQKKPILKRQNHVRTQISVLRQLERDLYFVHRKLDEASTDPELNQEAARLENRVNECKRGLMGDTEELRAMILCFKEHRLLQERAERARSVSGRKRYAETPAEVVRRTEVSFQHATWKLNEKDGQLYTAKIHLRKFLYTRVNKDNDSGEHDIELGHVKIENCLPAYSNTIYRDVLEPEREAGSASSVFRFFLKERAPVGGIPVKEHFEINVMPLVVHVQKEFYDKIMDFFFPHRGMKKVKETGGAGASAAAAAAANAGETDADSSDSPSAAHDDDTESVYSECSSTAPSGPALAPPLPVPHPRRAKSQHGKAVSANPDFIDEMKLRAEQNKTFLHIKIPDVEVRVSFKGEKEGRVGVAPPNINNWKFVIPTIEYHNMTWTWLDLVRAVRKDSIKSVLTQIPRQLIGVKQNVEKETSEEEKAKILFGNLSDSYALPAANGQGKKREGKKGPFAK